MANESHHTSEPSLAALLGRSIHDVQGLLGQELTRTKLEVRDELRKVKTAAFTLGIGVGVAAEVAMAKSILEITGAVQIAAHQEISAN